MEPYYINHLREKHKFQSSSAGDGGWNHIQPSNRTIFTTCFNPHPPGMADGTLVIRVRPLLFLAFQSSSAGDGGWNEYTSCKSWLAKRFNPHPPGMADGTDALTKSFNSLGGFNPHPPGMADGT